MKRKSPFWLIGIASLLFVGLLVSQVVWVFSAASQQEEQFNNQIDLALLSIEEKIEDDPDLCYSVECCLIEGNNKSCLPEMGEDEAWERTDSMISSELQRFEIDLNYNFDFGYKRSVQKSEAYEQEMDKVFDKSGIVLFLEFPDKTKYLRNQIGPVFISSVLLILFLSIAFILTYRYYKRERNFSQRTRDFINNMTHEFKTPLTNISLANNMIARGIDEQEKEKLLHYSAIIDDEATRLTKNCDDLLQIAKIENAQLEFTDPVDVHEIIEKVVGKKNTIQEQNNIEIFSDLKATNWTVLGRESLFYNTISNLIDNGIKYCEDAPKITVTTHNIGDVLHISISDNGIGMKAEEVDNIFDKFYRISEGDAHTIKGFGLGLAYVKMVVSKMKGRINVESKLGIGTTFKISIPTTTV